MPARGKKSRKPSSKKRPSPRAQVSESSRLLVDCEQGPPQTLQERDPALRSPTTPSSAAAADANAADTDADTNSAAVGYGATAAAKACSQQHPLPHPIDHTYIDGMPLTGPGSDPASGSQATLGERCSGDCGRQGKSNHLHYYSAAIASSTSGSLASDSDSMTREESELVPKFKAAVMSSSELKRISQEQGPKVAGYYEAQNTLIEELLQVSHNHRHVDDEEMYEAEAEHMRGRQRQVDIAVRVSVAVNVAVVVAQLYAAVSSKSLSLFATMSEAMMDLLSSIILLLASIAARRRDRFSIYPSGKYKLETIGVIVFAVLMGSFSVALLFESLSALAEGDRKANQLSLYDALCVVGALLAKVALYLYCHSLREFHTTHVLMTDHRNDIFVNAFGLSMAIAGKHLFAWVDAAGSLIIALIILKSWVEEAWDQIKLIVGISADPHLIQVLTYTAVTHHPSIELVDRVVAYHSGAKLFVEIDIVMPPTTPLRLLHDVAESLQEKYERMPGVGRCHVHVDYEVSHRSEHRNAVA